MSEVTDMRRLRNSHRTYISPPKTSVGLSEYFADLLSSISNALRESFKMTICCPNTVMEIIGPSVNSKISSLFYHIQTNKHAYRIVLHTSSNEPILALEANRVSCRSVVAVSVLEVMDQGKSQRILT